ncbi:Na+/H+ antiporter subunit A [Bacillus sp. S/N-304-OC-R1]|uniref:Na+/H+ antiporter subunit A n=1 Tax=Bacillus sp. S/N-304-OC-R1 TaxID=2758034 RepID=UPI001C8D900B|nr:Na+/H+ antiporter subunit A [Bacillus sp. S/N-304-OC-R1]MBY0122057.1 Na+/H+ antiporter subunit A [Bacillus sp. S/N-304-OC-R1]
MTFLPFIFAILIPFIYKLCGQKIHTGWFVVLVPLSLFLYFLQYIPLIASGHTVKENIPWMPSLNINITTYMDGLALIFGILITGVGTLVVLYSIYYMSKKREALHNFYVYMLLFMGAMLGLVFSDNILVLYVFWELTSISSFLLIAYWYQRQNSRYGAQKSMMITIFGGLAMLSGFIMLSIVTDTYSIREMLSKLQVISEHSLFLPAMILLLLGAFTKSAQFPFSIWLPDAMEAPTPISAYLHSATMVKAGIYLVARFTPVFGGTSEWFWIVTGVGLITLFYGSISAVNQKDLKALLAYSTISQLGLIMCLLGLGSASLYFGKGDETVVYAYAVLAAMFHLINHSTFKGSLFMVIGIIDHETGTRDIRKLGGLMSLMPISFTLTIIGSFAMAGIPPFNGFLSKEMFFTSVLTAAEHSVFGFKTLSHFIPFIAWVASVFTFIYCMIIVFKTFMGKHQPEKIDKIAKEAPIGKLIPPSILACLVIVIFFVPNVISKNFLQPALHAILPGITINKIEATIKPWHGWNTELLMTIGVVVAGFIMYKLLRRWLFLYDIYPKALTLNHLYNASLLGSEKISFKVTERYMTESIRDYLVYIFGFMIIILGSAIWLSKGYVINVANDSEINMYEAGIIVALVISAVTVFLSKSRLTAVVALGALGYLVSLLFVIFRAPDLALTQLVVETVTAALFLLCFYYLPELRKEKTRIKFKLTNMIISLGVGTIVTILALGANNHRLFASISGFFEDSYTLAGAKNIVNAILVDFRGLDTMLEILVLCIAGLGIYTLIKVQLAGRGKE